MFEDASDPFLSGKLASTAPSPHPHHGTSITISIFAEDRPTKPAQDLAHLDDGVDDLAFLARVGFQLLFATSNVQKGVKLPQALERQTPRTPNKQSKEEPGFTRRTGRQLKNKPWEKGG